MTFYEPGAYDHSVLYTTAPLTEGRSKKRNWGEPCSGRYFLVHFSDLILGPQDNGLIQERGVVAGTRVGVVIDACFSCSFGCCFAWCLGPFFGRYLGCSSVPGQGLDSCVVVWFSFLLLFWLALSLLSWLLFWSLLLCSWGLGPGLVLAWSFQFVLVTILVVIFCM